MLGKIKNGIETAMTITAVSGCLMGYIVIPAIAIIGGSALATDGIYDIYLDKYREKMMKKYEEVVEEKEEEAD